MRIELPDGQWALLRERLSYAQAVPVRRAHVAMSVDRLTMVDVDIAIVRAYLVDWHVLGVDGKAVPVETPEEAPDDVIQKVGGVAFDLWNGKPNPLAGNGTSRSTSLARRSR